MKSYKEPTKAEVFRARLLSTVVLLGLVGGAFWWGEPLALAGAVAAVATVALLEYGKLLQAGGFAGRECRWWMVLAGCFVLGGLGWMLAGGGEPPGFGWETGGAAATLLGAFALRMGKRIRERDSLEAVVMAVFGYVYVAVLFGTFVMRLLFEAPGENQAPGLFLVVFLIAVTKLTDIGAYVTGSLAGRHKMCPWLSPGKTWEGFAGAMVFAQAGAWIVWKLAGASLAWMLPWHVGALGLALALLAVAGDLAESILKRSLAVKDSGRFLPGIGGALDVIDSLCFTAPALYLYMTWAG